MLVAMVAMVAPGDSVRAYSVTTPASEYSADKSPVSSRTRPALAHRSAAAAMDIKRLTAASTGQVKAGEQLVTTAGRTMEGVVQAVERAAQLMADMAQEGVRQQGGITEVHAAIVQMDGVTQQNAAMVEQAAAAAQATLEQAEALEQAVAVAVFTLD